MITLHKVMRRIIPLWSVSHGQMIQKDEEGAGNPAGTLMTSHSLITTLQSVILIFNQILKTFQWHCLQFTAGSKMMKIINPQLHIKQLCNM